MNVLLQSLPALIGVALGALGSYVASSAHERSRWRRTQASRWDERRLLAYVDYGTSVRAINYLSSRIIASRGLAGQSESLPSEKDFALLAAAEANRAERWQAVLVLGHPKTIAAGNALNEFVWTLEWLARGKLKEEQEWQDAWKAVYDARDAFFNSARVDLGIAGGDLPERNWAKEWDLGHV